MIIALRAKNKLRFINGKIKIPKELAEFEKWQWVDNMVLSWILDSIPKELMDSSMQPQLSSCGLN